MFLKIEKKEKLHKLLNTHGPYTDPYTYILYTTGTRVGPGSASSYAKILGETKFQLREFPWSGWKAIDIEEGAPGKLNQLEGMWRIFEKHFATTKLEALSLGLVFNSSHHPPHSTHPTQE